MENPTRFHLPSRRINGSPKQENKSKWAIVAAVEELGFTTQVFLDPTRDALNFRLRKASLKGCVLLSFPTRSVKRHRFKHRYTGQVPELISQ